MAASFTLMPFSWFLKMFSITTMALSTSIPAPKARPPRVMMLMVRSYKIHEVEGGNDGDGDGKAHNQGVPTS